VRCYVAEAVGTAILVLVGPGAAMVAAATHAFGHAGVALAFGLVVALLVAALGTTSGAHLNPAVTLAFWSARRFPARAVAPYVLAQCAGAVAASLALRWILGPVGRLGAVSGVDTSAADAPAADAPLPARGKPVKRAGTVPASPPSRARRRHGG
jgi:glycerol uptake facilitator-like aquaporin